MRLLELETPTTAPFQIEVDESLHIPKILEEGGWAGYEPSTTAVLLSSLDAAPNGTFYDIGANFGLYTLLACAHGGRDVVAVEPWPPLTGALTRCLETNGFHADIVTGAIADRRGIAHLHVSKTSDASNSLLKNFRESVQTVRTNVYTLPDILRANETPGLIKIDVEGVEHLALAGSEGLVAQTRPWILIELMPGLSAEPCKKIMKRLGYHGHPVRSLTNALPAHRADDLNWIYTPTPLTRAFISDVRQISDAL